MACDQKVGDGIPLRVSPDGCCALRTAHFEANLGRVCVRAETQQDIVIDNIHRESRGRAVTPVEFELRQLGVGS